MKNLVIASLLSVVALSGCTDAAMSKITSYGSEAHVKCYSGSATPVIDYHSTGKVHNEEHSDGFYFKAKEDGKAHSVSGACDITYE
jgi:hypothetical protein